LMAAVQQTRQAKRALQRVLEIMVARIDRLIVVVAAGKKLSRPLKRPRDKRTVSVGKHAQVNGRNTRLRHTGVFGVRLVKHSRRVLFLRDIAIFFRRVPAARRGYAARTVSGATDARSPPGARMMRTCPPIGAHTDGSVGPKSNVDGVAVAAAMCETPVSWPKYAVQRASSAASVGSGRLRAISGACTESERARVSRALSSASPPMR